MKNIKLLLLLINSLFIIAGCGPSNVVKVSDFSPQGKVENLTTFTIEFSENLAPPEIQDKWLTDEFVKFEPKISGKFKWTSAKTLIFSPDSPLDPIQDYKAQITNKVLFNTNYSPDFKEYEFHTPDFDATSADFFWTQIPNQNYKLSVQANLHFNYPVVPGQLKDYLEVLRDGVEVKDFQIMSESPADVIAINFGDVNQTNKNQDLVVIIKKGLQSILGKKPLQDGRKFKQQLPPITRLAITSVSSGYDGNTGWILVNTTQTVDEKKLKDFVSTNPHRDLTFTVNQNSFRIEADFGGIPTIDLSIKKGLPGLYGGQLEFDYSQTISLVNLNPSINFADKSGIYLMLSGQKNLEVNAVNLDKVEVEVSQVFKNNLIYFLDRYGYYDEYNDYYNDRNYYVENFGRSLYTQKIDLPDKQNWLQKFTINLNKVIGQKYKGIFVVNVRSEDDLWRSDAKMVALSDLGIITKKSKDEIIVFINSIATTDPVPDVNISVISTNNQTILSGKTGKDGIIKFTDVKSKIEGFTPRLIIAEKDNDFNYIDLNKTRVETSRFDVGGIYEYAEGYNAFLYSERNLYRPGEKINLSGIVRNGKIKVIKDIPVIVKIITPTGKVFDKYKETLNDEGSFELSFDIPGFAQTGEYNAELYTGSSQLIGSYKFSVEDFVPDKIRVRVKSDKEKVKPGETVSVDVESEFLFGAKAAGLKYEGEVQLIYSPYISKKYPKFDFSQSSIVNSKIENTRVDGLLDENGKANLKYTIPKDIETGGIFKGSFYVSVFDLTGRTVNQAANFSVYPDDYYIGIKKGDYYFGTNEKINFQLVAVDQNDKPLGSFKAKASLVRYEWQTVLKKNNQNQYYYASEQKAITEWTRDIDISGGPKDFSFSVIKSGKYELRVSKAGSSDYQKTQFYAYGWGSSTASSFEVDKEGRVEIVLDKKSYSPGETAKVLITAPFSGKVLLTFERDNVIDYKYINLENRSTQVEESITEDFMPNVYVTATLFRKHSLDNSAPFLVAHGFVSMKVERKENKLPVTISAPKKIKPNTRQQITVSTLPEKNIYVTLAAVDEGILQIKDYKTPDPYGFMYAKRSLMVSTHDLYKLLLPEIISMNPTPGGGENEELKQIQKRTNPIPSQRFKLLSVWSGILKSNSEGKVTVPVDIPQFNGDVRLMAVVYSGSRFGNAEEHMKVADDIILEAEIPRFLSTNDSLNTTVSVINNTSSKGQVNVSLNVSGPLNVTSSKDHSVTIEPNSVGRVNFSINTGKQVGTGKITFTTSGIAKVKKDYDISIRPISPYVVENGSGMIKAEQNVDIKIPAGYLKGTQKSTLTMSKFPAVKFAKQLRYLVGYPYGCIEQTVSKLFPQLYFEDLAKLVAPQYYKTHNPNYFVNEGIKKIESMQLADGSISYWPGETYTNWWGSVYAAHFLVEARKAGFGVSESVLSKLINYIAKRARENKTYDYVTYSNGMRTVKKIANKEILYSLYVLALAGKSDISTMNYYKARPHLLTNDTWYLLAGAYAIAGQWNTYYEMMPKTYTPEKTIRLTGGCFDSEVRANAIMLNVVLEVQPTSDQIPYMIKHLSELADQIYSTQDRSFTFLALGKAAKLNANTKINVKIILNNKTLKTYDGTDLTLDLPENSSSITLSGTGTGAVYYFWNTSGIKLNNNVKEEDSFMKVRRTYYEYSTGREVNYNTVGQGQLLVCKISLTGMERSAENIVITDMLPAGFEIENPRLSTSTELQWKPKNPVDVQYLDIRDDRLLLFTNLQANSTREFYYMLRVVNKGKFQLPVIGAEAMYDPEFHSYNGAGVMKVVGR